VLRRGTLPSLVTSTQGRHEAGGCMAAGTAADFVAEKAGNATSVPIWALWAAGGGCCEAAIVGAARAVSGAAAGCCEAAGMKVVGTAGGAVGGDCEVSGLGSRKTAFRRPFAVSMVSSRLWRR